MSSVGIEAINVFAGTAFLDVKKLAEHRQLDTTRFENLLMKEKTVDGADFAETFTYLAYHTLFGGMVKGVPRNMMRKLVKSKSKAIEEGFERRVLPSLNYCQRVGSIMGATAALLLSTIIMVVLKHRKELAYSLMVPVVVQSFLAVLSPVKAKSV